MVLTSILESNIRYEYLNKLILFLNFLHTASAIIQHAGIAQESFLAHASTRKHEMALAEDAVMSSADKGIQEKELHAA